MSGKGNLASLRASSQADLFQLLLLLTCLMGAAGLEALGTGGTPNHLWVTLCPMRWGEEVRTTGGHCEKCPEGQCGALR